VHPLRSFPILNFNIHRNCKGPQNDGHNCQKNKRTQPYFCPELFAVRSSHFASSLLLHLYCDTLSNFKSVVRPGDESIKCRHQENADQ
jgi:hypothetical protein